MMLRSPEIKQQVREALEHAKNLGIRRERITEIIAMGERRRLKENMKTFQGSIKSLDAMSLTQQLKIDTETPLGGLDLSNPGRLSFNTNKPHMSKNPLTNKSTVKSRQPKFKPLDDLSLDIN